MADLRPSQRDRQKKKGNPGAGLIAVVVIVVLNLLRSAGERGDAAIAALIAVAVVALVIVAIASALKKAAAARGERGAVTRSGRTAAAVRRPDPRSRSFTPPEPSCIVCDHTGEDHFARDRARRIAQLDDWLKTGLIDRAEYQVLRRRYENDL